MAKLDPFVEYLLELLQPVPGVTARRMFGGYGIFRDGLMFGLVADDVLYLKVDDQSVGDFADHGLEPFVYVKEGKPMPMSYYQAPGEALDNPDDMVEWAEKAYAAALRAQAARPKRRKKGVK
ncbi:MAG: transcriptional regulator [Chloroflexi bacterium]|nr:MAG: transcriptional regulator [Chloroflexota bacterium]